MRELGDGPGTQLVAVNPRKSLREEGSWRCDLGFRDPELQMI